MTELLSAFTLTIDYVYGYRLTSKINERFRTEFRELHRDGISSCNSGIPRNSFQFPPIPLLSNSASIQFPKFRPELLSAFTLTIDYVYGYRLTSKINERFRTESRELHRDGISSCSSGFPRNSFQFPPIPLLSNFRNYFLPSPSLLNMYMVID